MNAARQVDAGLHVAGDSRQQASADARPAADALQPAVCFGAVMHERHVQAHNRFIYPTAFLRLPLSRLATLRAPLLGIERGNVFSFRNRDHGARDGSPLLPWIHALLRAQGLAEICDGEIVLQTMPRIFGFVFNPVSFWFCHDRDGALRAVLAEVTTPSASATTIWCTTPTCARSWRATSCAPPSAFTSRPSSRCVANTASASSSAAPCMRCRSTCGMAANCNCPPACPAARRHSTAARCANGSRANPS